MWQSQLIYSERSANPDDLFVAHEFIIPAHDDESSSAPVKIIYNAIRADGLVQEVTFELAPEKGLVVVDGTLRSMDGSEVATSTTPAKHQQLPFHPYTKYGEVLIAVQPADELTSRSALLNSLRKEYGNAIYNIDKI